MPLVEEHTILRLDQQRFEHLEVGSNVMYLQESYPVEQPCVRSGAWYRVCKKGANSIYFVDDLGRQMHLPFSYFGIR